MLGENWARPNGYRDVLALGLPLVASLSSTTLMQFTDRVFLSNYSLDAIAAATPAGITSFLFQCFFLGTAAYVNVFVAQYVGAGAGSRVGASLWQGIYFALLAGLALAGLSFLGGPIFSLSGHPAEVQALERTYYWIMTLGGGLRILSTTLMSFFSGRGQSRPVMAVNIIGASANIPLDYALINGWWIFPEMGIAGAALATILSEALVAGLFARLIFTRANERGFSVLSARRLVPDLFGRLMKYGLPGGVQFFMDILAITFFVFMTGRLSKEALAASNIALSINHLAFMPVIGLSIATNTLVGQAIGRRAPQEAITATRNSLHLALSYMILSGLVFVIFPEWLLELFRTRHLATTEYTAIIQVGVVLLRLVALYSLFDALAIIYSGGLKGAGDSRFVMWAMGGLALTTIILPVYLIVEILGAGLLPIWICLTAYVIILGLVLRWRFKQGRWQKMRVIESDL